MSQEASGDTYNTVFSELLMIAYLCGYAGQPMVGGVKEIMKRCVSLGPQGYGLALYALIVALSGGTIPYFTVMPVPFGNIGRIEKMCVIDGVVLASRGITRDEGFFTHIGLVNIGETESTVRMVEIPEAFGVAIIYRDVKGRRNYRAFIVQHAQNTNYPWLSVIPSDSAVEIMCRLCEEDHIEAVEEDLALLEKHFEIREIPKRRAPSREGAEKPLEELIFGEVEDEPL